MPQPRERQQRHRNQQDQSPNKQDPRAQRHAKEAQGSGEAQESGKRSNPDRYPDQGKQARKPSDAHYPEQDPSGKAERPDAVEGAESGRSDRLRNRDDLN